MARARLAGALAAVGVLAAACVTNNGPPADRSGQVRSSVPGPIRDLNLVREDLPPALVEAASDPYAVPSPADCQTLTAKVAALDDLLGPDVDVADRTGGGQDLVGGVINGVIGLPFSGVIRQISGAAAREREARRIVLAAIARRSFLKGLASSRNCAAPAPPK